MTAHRLLDRYQSVAKSLPADQLVLMWTCWAVLFSIFTFICLFVWLAITLSKKVRRSPFNLYLIYLMIPDWFYTINCAITCTLNVVAGHYYSQSMCYWQSFYIIWGIGGNAWLNAVICSQVHRMLRSSYDRRHYRPPTKRAVTIHALLVNVGILLLAGVGIFSMRGWPIRTMAASGLTCLPLEYNKMSTIFMWCVYLPLWIGIPYFYVVYVAVDIWWRRLMPPRGRRRALAIYFFRIVGVFVLMWGPVFVMTYAFAGMSPWLVFVASIWAHMQASVSAVVALLKPDVAEAARQLATCKLSALLGWVEEDVSHLPRKWSTAKEYEDVPVQSSVDFRFVDETSELTVSAAFGEPTDFCVRDEEDDESHLPVAPAEWEMRESSGVCGPGSGANDERDEEQLGND